MKKLKDLKTGDCLYIYSPFAVSVSDIITSKIEVKYSRDNIMYIFYDVGKLESTAIIISKENENKSEFVFETFGIKFIIKTYIDEKLLSTKRNEKIKELRKRIDALLG